MRQQTIGTVARPVMRPVVNQQLGFTSYHHLGDATTTAYSALQLGAVALGAYHGYKRNRSVGWAIGWALLAGLSPVITTAVAFAQGIGKRKGG